MTDLDINSIITEGSIIDNRRIQNGIPITLRDIVKSISKESIGLKCAVGYFYIEGLILIIESLKDLRELKILMGIETTKLTKQELIRAFKTSLNSIEKNSTKISSISLFHKMVKESKTLKVRIYLQREGNAERLHSKAYIFFRNIDTQSFLDRYKAAIIGSSNLTPSGLMGNTELNVIIRDGRDLQYLENWFDNLWLKGSEEFEKLKVTEAISTAIQESKFGNEIKEKFVYVSPIEFFTNLIKHVKAEYLFEDWKTSKLLGFQQIDAIRCLMLFREKNYRGIFLTSSVGLGKSYVACQIASYFLRNEGKILLIAPSGLIDNQDQWPRYMKEFNLLGKIDILGMGKLQKDPFSFEDTDLQLYKKNYSLIIIDEAHNYRNRDSFRTRNLKLLIDKNGDSKILFLTATPINTNPQDLINLIDLFYRKNSNLQLDKIYRNLLEVISILVNTPYEKLDLLTKKKISHTQETLEKNLFVKSTRETIKLSPEYIEQIKLFAGVDIKEIQDPIVEEVIYNLNNKYKKIVNEIVIFLSKLTAANLRIVDPNRGKGLQGFFKWILYKRFESDISSYYVTLMRIYKRNKIILNAIEKRNIHLLIDIDDNSEDNVEVNFDFQYREKLEELILNLRNNKELENVKILKDLEEDTRLIYNQIKELKSLLISKDDILFNEDMKLAKLFDCLKGNKSKRILIFTEYRDTLKAIKSFLKDKIEKTTIEFIDSSTINKSQLIEKFNNGDTINVLVTTDTLSEGYNISGADVVINFDIPYNPVKLIQRIGRATRLDNPKLVNVLNFRPSEDIDKEIVLVDRLKLRIEDIIRFVGIEYRIWFQKEEELIKNRRQFDKKIYMDILKGIRQDIWKGKFNKLEVPISFARPILTMMQKAIIKYKLTKENVNRAKLYCNIYTTLHGDKNLTVFYDVAKSFNEDKITSDIIEADNKINFEEFFNNELSLFKNHIQNEKANEIIASYYNDRTDKLIRIIKETIITRGYLQIYSGANTLINLLSKVRDNCGSSTEKLIKNLYKDIKDRPKEVSFDDYNNRIKNSFTEKTIQQKLIMQDEPYLALGFLEK